MFTFRSCGAGLWATLTCLTLAASGCSNSKKMDIALIEDNTLVTPDTPIVLPLNVHNQVKIYDRWYDIFNDAGQIDEYLARQAQKYKTLYVDHGIALDKRTVRGERLLVLPTEVFIEPETRTKMGAVSRLTRICRDHGFYKVTIRREAETAG